MSRAAHNSENNLRSFFEILSDMVPHLSDRELAEFLERLRAELWCRLAVAGTDKSKRRVMDALGPALRRRTLH